MRFRSLFAFIATLAALVALPLVGTLASAHAAETPGATAGTTYVYWSHWGGKTDGGWTASNVGAGSQTPADGSVIGWRWGAGQSGSINQPPRTPANFADICASTPAQSGQKRVGVVIDFGTPQVAPDGQTPTANVTQCVLGATAENGLQVTASAVAQRSTPEGMVCGLNGYPSTGCGGPVAAAAASAEAPASSASSSTSTSSDSSSGWLPFAIGIIVLIVLIVVGALVAKRRKSE